MPRKRFKWIMVLFGSSRGCVEQTNCYTWHGETIDFQHGRNCSRKWQWRRDNSQSFTTTQLLCSLQGYKDWSICTGSTEEKKDLKKPRKGASTALPEGEIETSRQNADWLGANIHLAGIQTCWKLSQREKTFFLSQSNGKVLIKAVTALVVLARSHDGNFKQLFLFCFQLLIHVLCSPKLLILSNNL